MHLDLIKAPVQDNFQAVNDLILHSLRSNASIINDLGHYIIQSGGKRLRPLMVLLLARACGYTGEHHIPLATVIEFIHTATLLHDDVVDNSNCRRGQKTANTLWGNQAAVLVGDFLYSKALQILVTINNPRIIQVIANTTNMMAEGEAFQLLERHNPKTTEHNYLNIIRCKTAKLFEAAAQSSAILGESEPNIEEKMVQYGMHLGTAFQLIDDLLDYQNPLSQTGKVPGNDLTEGKATLPLIYILQNGTTKEKRMIEEAIQQGSNQNFSIIQEIIESSGALEYTRHTAKIEAEKAQRALATLKHSAYRDAAYTLTEFAINRNY